MFVYQIMFDVCVGKEIYDYIMTFKKQMRVSNPDLIKSMRHMRCIACGQQNSEAHHVKTVKSGGDDSPENLIPLCREHHQLWHLKGARYMSEFFPQVRRWLIAAGWRLDDLKKTWRR